MRRLNTLTVVILLECYALLLAGVHMPGGVLTDEAKYLLNIPYPHPPLLRSIMGFTSSFPLHEFFWRIVFASALVQVVWLIWDLAEVLPGPKRIALSLSWLLASSVVLQSGSIVLAVVASVFGVVFLWFALHPAAPERSHGPLLGILWFLSLFTVYQSILYLPLLIGAFRRAHIPARRTLLYLGLPIFLLLLYSLTNPLALASMGAASGQDGALLFSDRFLSILTVWMLGGSAVLSLAGTWGILTSERLDLVLTFGLVFGFIILTSQQYYAVLLTPLFIGGVFLLFCRRRILPGVFIAAEICMTVVLLILFSPPMHPTSAREVMKALQERSLYGPYIINGFFGHEWQYESYRQPIYRFSQDLRTEVEEEAQFIVCTRGNCEGDIDMEKWEKVGGMLVEVWKRR